MNTVKRIKVHKRKRRAIFIEQLEQSLWQISVYLDTTKKALEGGELQITNNAYLESMVSNLQQEFSRIERNYNYCEKGY